MQDDIFTQPVEASDALEAIRDRFKSALLRGEHPSIAKYLPPDGTDREAVLIELVHVPTWKRVWCGESRPELRSILRIFQNVLQDAKLAIGLIRREFHLRRHREPGLNADEFQRRFPDFDLNLQFSEPTMCRRGGDRELSLSEDSAITTSFKFDASRQPCCQIA